MSAKQYQQRGDIGLLFLIILASCAVAAISLVFEWIRYTKDHRGQAVAASVPEEAGPSAEQVRHFTLVD